MYYAIVRGDEVKKGKISPTFSNYKGTHPTWNTIEETRANWTRSKFKRAKRNRKPGFRTSIKGGSC